MTTLLLVVVLAVFVATFAYPPVSRARLELFARRHSLTITATNGNHVIAYLATTRRHRVVGAVFGALASLAMSLSEGRIEVGLLAPVAGWFSGALIAEVRLAPPRRLAAHQDARRAASLAPRVAQSYVSPFAWRLLPAMAWLSVVVSALLATVAGRGANVGASAVAWSAAAVVVAFVVVAVRRQVLRRAQPAVEPDVLAADDAVRSRSLHVLTGGGMALVGCCVIGQLIALQPAVNDSAWAMVAVAELLVGAIATVGAVVVATLRWPVRNRGRVAGLT